MNNCWVLGNKKCICSDFLLNLSYFCDKIRTNKQIVGQNKNFIFFQHLPKRPPMLYFFWVKIVLSYSSYFWKINVTRIFIRNCSSWCFARSVKKPRRYVKLFLKNIISLLLRKKTESTVNILVAWPWETKRAHHYYF